MVRGACRADDGMTDENENGGFAIQMGLHGGFLDVSDMEYIQLCKPAPHVLFDHICRFSLILFSLTAISALGGCIPTDLWHLMSGQRSSIYVREIGL